MRAITVTNQKVVGCVAAWWTVFLLLGTVELGSIAPLHTAIGFLFLMFVPGLLTLGALRIHYDNTIVRGMYALGVSLFELLLFGLVVNIVLPEIGIMRPLDTVIFGSLYTVFIALLATWYYFKNRWEKNTYILSRTILFGTKCDIWMAFGPIIFVVLAVLGASYLNAGGNGIFTLIALLGIAFYSVLVLIHGERIREYVLSLSLFFISLALLLMTSLRSEFIIGHDIQREFYVFELTKWSGLWSIDLYRDAYNACLSITILPTILANLLPISDVYVYKFLFQTLFAIVPSVLFVLIRPFVTKQLAYASTLFFVAFPTFFTDMPFLLRQEIAFLFLALMFLALFGGYARGKVYRLHALFFGFGIVLSHYSTTYIVIATLLFTLVMFTFFRLARKKMSGISFFRYSGIHGLAENLPLETKKVTVALVVLLSLASIFWSGAVTETSSGSITRVVSGTFSSIISGSWDDTRSGDIKHSLLVSSVVDTGKLFRNYHDQIVTPAREGVEEDVFYDETTYQGYDMTVLQREEMPLSVYGRLLQSLGISVPSSVALIKETNTKSVQLFILIGFVGILFSARYLKRALDPEFALLAAASLSMVASIVLLPVLSTEYGVLRAFQQSLMFLGLFATFGVLSVFFFLSEKIAHRVLYAFVIIFFLSSTGAIAELTGGYEPSLHLNNSGLYYDFYYLRQSEVAGLTWLGKKVEELGTDVQSERQIDPTVYTGMTQITDPNTLNTIHPGLIRKGAYVFLNYTNMHKKESTIIYNDTFITYQYPVEFVDTVKDRVYDNGDVTIFR